MSGNRILAVLPRRGWPGYATATLAVGATYLLRLLADPILGESAFFLPFVLPVVFTVLACGRGPGVWAGILSLAAAFSLVDGPDRFSSGLLLQAAVFVAVCGGLGWLDRRGSTQTQLARRANRQLDLFVDQVKDYAIFLVDDQSHVLTWNAGGERVLGWPKERVIGLHTSEFLSDPNARETAMAHLEQARREGRFSEEVWQRRADGSEFLANVSITPISDERGTNLGFAKIVYDTTARRAEARALQRREEHLKSILATVPDGMVVIDEHGIMLSFSSAAERLFGHTEEEVIGRNVKMLMPSPDRERHDGYLARYLETGVPRIIGTGRIVTGLRADGTTFPMTLSVGEAIAGDQRLFTGFIQDLTEKRAVEHRLEQLRSELIHVSRVSAMGTMASTLAHELNQPLTAIASYGQAAEVLLERPEEPDREVLREVFGQMASQALRAGGIVRRLREFVSRGELEKTIADLPKLIGEAAGLALIGAREKGVTTEFRLDPSATPVLIDKVQIQQVLINLMRNAVEAMQGSPDRLLTISTSLRDPATVQVSVADTGPGIAPGIRDNMFEAFNSSKAEGMGLGLSICRTIVEAHGGRISARDRPGGGTEFLFTLTRFSEDQGPGDSAPGLGAGEENRAQ